MSVHGTAHWGNRADLKAAGLTGRKSGLMIGWWVDGENPYDSVRYDGDLHQLIVGGVGGGKFTTAIAPMLFGSGLEQDTVVVIDPKGEIAQATGPFFQQAFADKPSVFVLDPWDEAGTGSTSVLNFVALLDQSNPNSVDDARALADAMILSSGAENTHWDNAARNFLASVLLYVALDPSEKDQRDLIRVREIVTLPFSMPKAYQGPKQDTLSELLFKNLDSPLAAGAVKRSFRALLNREERELSGIISSVERDTAWIDSPQMARVLRGDSLDMKAAALEGGKYYIVIPPDFFMTHRYWLRLCVTAFAKAFRRYRPNTPRGTTRRWRHIVIDEFANLGEMNFILTDIAVSRGYDVKYHLVIQDLGQLARVYQQGWESFINNSFQRFFAVSDLFTANYVSGLLGVTTVEGTSSSEGESGSDGSSHTETDGYSQGANVATGMGHNSESFGKSTSVAKGWTQSKGWSRGQTFTQVQRPLRTPDEVRRLDDGLQYVLIRGQLPTILWRPVYWELFPSLPDFSLKEVMGTIGRRPVNALEHAKFTRWRSKPLLISPTRKRSLMAAALRWLFPRIPYRIVGALALVSVIFLAVWSQLPIIRSPNPQVSAPTPTSAQPSVPPDAPTAGETAMLKLRADLSRYVPPVALRTGKLDVDLRTEARSVRSELTDAMLESVRLLAETKREAALARLATYPLGQERLLLAKQTIEKGTRNWFADVKDSIAKIVDNAAFGAVDQIVADAKAKIDAVTVSTVETEKNRIIAEAERELASATGAVIAAKLTSEKMKEIDRLVTAAQQGELSSALKRASEIRTAANFQVESVIRQSREIIDRYLDSMFADVQQGVDADRETASRISPQTPALPPRSAAVVAAAPAAPAATPPKPGRAPLPKFSTVLEMGANANTRDYLIQLIRDNFNKCAVGMGEIEQRNMERLVEWTMRSVPSSALMDLATTQKYQMRLSPYFARQGSWTKRDRQEVLDILLQGFHENGSRLTVQMYSALRLFYADGKCPFETVSEADYQPPMYGSGQNLSKYP